MTFQLSTRLPVFSEDVWPLRAAQLTRPDSHVHRGAPRYVGIAAERARHGYDVVADWRPNWGRRGDRVVECLLTAHPG